VLVLTAVDLVRPEVITGIPTAIISCFLDPRDSLWDSICRGKMWVQLGLVLSLILSPVGTVDPVEKTSIMLEHVKKEVTSLAILIFSLYEKCTVHSKVVNLKLLKHVSDTEFYAFSHFKRWLNRKCLMQMQWK